MLSKVHTTFFKKSVKTLLVKPRLKVFLIKKVLYSFSFIRRKRIKIIISKKSCKVKEEDH